MKKNIKRLQFVLATLSLFLVGTVNAGSIGSDYTLSPEFSSAEKGDNLVGGWSYTVEGAPEGYEKGFLVITKQNDRYKVQVQVGTGTFLGENVMVKGEEISFDIMVEGNKVSLTLVAKGSSISGKGTSADGSYTINGVKSISTE